MVENKGLVCGPNNCAVRRGHESGICNKRVCGLHNIMDGELDKIRRQHVFKLMGKQDRVLRSSFAQKKGGDRSGRPRSGRRCFRSISGLGLLIYYI